MLTMRKTLALFALLLFSFIVATAQNKTITGKVTDQNGQAVDGASVIIKGTNTGTAAGTDGFFRISAKTGDVLSISAINFTSTEITVGTESSYNITLQRTAGVINEVIVTALGIRRSKNQLPYAAQQVSGADVNKQRSGNFVTNLEGKVAGLQINQSNTLGGSTNVVLRGNKSLTGSNQALFVVDGVPFDNSATNPNAANQTTGRGGYDYGNAAADINPDDIESITVLKGAAASALYGSRGFNGVILVTTKKGRKGLGITFNAGLSTGAIDKKTFAKYQKQYGGGYGYYYESPDGHFLYRDINGDGTPDLVDPMSEDASYGAAFDPNLMVYQWDAFDSTSPYYLKPKPWVVAAHDPTSYFEKPFGYNTSIFVDGGNDKATFKLGYTRNDDKGILPNSRVLKDMINFNSTYNITTKLSAGGSFNFVKINGLGRYGTGYDAKNPATNFRQWWEVNNDVLELKDAYFRTKRNITWNWADPTDLEPIYWDNPYWDRYENYETDSRFRYYGNANVNYKITDWLNIMGRISLDSYDQLQEERIAVGSIDVPQYSRFNETFREWNYDLLISFDKDITKDFNVKALLGGNLRRDYINSVFASTNGGLIVPKIYSLSNSLNPPNAPTEQDLRKEVQGVFAGATLAYKNMLILDGTVRRDQSSTLPKGNNTYYYPSVSLGFVFSNLIKNSSWLSYGKLRGNYAEVGNDAPYYSTLDFYVINPPFGSQPLTSVSGTKNNLDLLPERVRSKEVGLEMNFLKNRIGFDVTYYNAKSIDEIIPVAVSNATGYTSKFYNSGTVVNKGIEASLNGTPVKTKNLSWDLTLNFTRNRNKVTALYEGTDNLLLATFQGGVSINATLGQPFGTIRGSNFVYTNGQKTVDADGYYLFSPTSNEVIGDPNPDWIGSVSSTLRYKDFSFNFLIDTRQGGDIFTLDLYYGFATGLYPETAYTNDLGKPVRNLLSDGGGLIFPGVTEDGKPNTVRVDASNYGTFGYVVNPAAAFIYDASFVKLREASITYTLPSKWISKMALVKGIDLSVVGRNLWIIHKNLPYADPEEIISAGNYLGYQGGAYPTVRTFTFNIRARF